MHSSADSNHIGTHSAIRVSAPTTLTASQVPTLSVSRPLYNFYVVVAGIPDLKGAYPDNGTLPRYCCCATGIIGGRTGITPVTRGVGVAKWTTWGTRFIRYHLWPGSPLWWYAGTAPVPNVVVVATPGEPTIGVVRFSY